MAMWLVFWGFLCINPLISSSLTPQILRAMHYQAGQGHLLSTSPHGPTRNVTLQCRVDAANSSTDFAPQHGYIVVGAKLVTAYASCALRPGRFCKSILYQRSGKDTHDYRMIGIQYDCFLRSCSDVDVANYAGNMLFGENSSTDQASIFCEDEPAEFGVGTYFTMALLFFLGMLVIVGTIVESYVKLHLVDAFAATEAETSCDNTVVLDGSTDLAGAKSIPKIILTRPTPKWGPLQRTSSESVITSGSENTERRFPPIAMPSLGSVTSDDTCASCSKRRCGTMRRSGSISQIDDKSHSCSDLSGISASFASVYETLNFSDPSVFISALQPHQSSLGNPLPGEPSGNMANNGIRRYCCAVSPRDGFRRFVTLLTQSSVVLAAKGVFRKGQGFESSFAFANALQTIALWWFLFYQTAMYMGSSLLIDNSEDFLSALPGKGFQLISNSFLHLQSIFFWRGILDAVSVMLHLDNVTSISGIFRALLAILGRKFLFEFPSYIIAIIIWSFMTPLVATGPNWNSLRYNNCKQLWWTSALYISNFYPGKFVGQCMPWSWLIACEMQLFIVGILLIALLSKRRKLGVITTGATVLLTTLLDSYISLEGNLKRLPVPEFYAESTNNTTDIGMGTQSGDSFDLLLTKPHYYWASYAIGIVMGQQIRPQRRFGKAFELALWTLNVTCVACLTMIIISGFMYYDDLPFVEGPIIFNLLPKLWILFLIPIAIYFRHITIKGPFSSTITKSFWTVVSRLNLSVFLVHPPVLGYIFFRAKATFHFNITNLVVYFFASVLASYMLVFVIRILFSTPLRNVARYLLGCIFPSLREIPLIAQKAKTDTIPKNILVKNKRTTKRRRISSKSRLKFLGSHNSFESIFTPLVRK